MAVVVFKGRERLLTRTQTNMTRTGVCCPSIPSYSHPASPPSPHRARRVRGRPRREKHLDHLRVAVIYSQMQRRQLHLRQAAAIRRAFPRYSGARPYCGPRPRVSTGRLRPTRASPTHAPVCSNRHGHETSPRPEREDNSVSWIEERGIGAALSAG